MNAHIELGDIIRENISRYKKDYQFTAEQNKAMSAISRCRTESMGKHILECSQCGYREFFNNSCRNRHCPKCQGSKQEEWVEKIKQQLLPCRYFHVVFTLPSALNPVVQENQQVLYDILLKSSGKALMQACSYSNFLGVEAGCLSVMHTWGQNLMLHPHVHMLVPAGGLTEDGWEWKESGKKFFVPVKTLSKIFRAKFISMLQEAIRGEQVAISVEIDLLIKHLYSKNWNVYCKKTFGGPKQVLTYLSRYTHRVAISNSRIISADNKKVSFRWKDYREQIQKWKVMELDTLEFIRRFLLHILPCNFYKIRYYGILSLSKRKDLLKQCFYLITGTNNFWEEIKISGNNQKLCPVCKLSYLRFKGILIQKE